MTFNSVKVVMTVTAPGESFKIEQASNALQGRRWFKKGGGVKGIRQVRIKDS